MSGQAPPAIRHKQADRRELLRDADYFATELIRRIERIARVDKATRRLGWGQAAALIRRIRQAIRGQLAIDSRR